MEFLTNISAHRLTVSLKGKLDKSFRISQQVYDILDNDGNISEVVFVLRKVEEFNPDVVEAWLLELKKLSEKGYDLTFIECPRILLEPVLKNMKKYNLKRIRSFVVPYYCNVCNEEFPQLINTSSMSLSFASYNKPLCPSCKRQLSLDVTEEELERIASLLPEHDVFADKRKFPRFDISSYNMPLTVKNDGRVNTYQISNFSEAGICFSGKDFIETGKTVQFTAEVKKEKASSMGTIVWSAAQEDDDSYIFGAILASNEIFQLLIKI